MQGRHIALQAAVGLDGHKAALGAQALALGRDDVDVVGVDLGYDHRHVRGKAVRAVVGHDRALGLGVGLLQCLDLILLHVDGAKDEIDLGGDLLHIGGVQHDHLFNALGHGGLHQPAAADGLLIGFASVIKRWPTIPVAPITPTLYCFILTKTFLSRYPSLNLCGSHGNLHR